MTINQLYSFLKTNIEAVTAVNGVAMYNNDITFLDQLPTHHLPFVAIEFINLEYQTEARKQVSGNIEINLHVLQATTDGDNSQLLEVPELIKTAMNELRLIYLIGQTVDHSHNNITDNIISLETNRVDLYDYTQLTAEPVPVINGIIGQNASCDALLGSITDAQMQTCIIPNIDFSDDDNINALTDLQIAYLEQYFMVDLYPQNTEQLGNVSGVFNLAYTKSWKAFTLTGDITSFGFSSFPNDNKSVNFNLTVTQGGTGAHTIDFTGSGVRPSDGLTAADLQPLTGVGSITEYAFRWDGTILKVNINKIGPAL